MSGLSGLTPQETALEFVSSKFTNAEEWTNEMLSTLNDSLDELSRVSMTIAFTDVPTIDVDRFTGNYPFPVLPNAPVLVPNFPVVPTRPQISEIAIPPIPVPPDATIGEFTDAFNWQQSKYNRYVLEQFRDRLLDFINNGGTGLAAEVEQAIYDRDKLRQEYIDEQRFLEVQNFFESRGNTMPSGQHAAAINRAASERARMYEEISRTVMIKAAELEQENMRIAQDTLVKVETILSTIHDAEEGRSLEAEKTRVTIALESYKAYVQGVIARLELYKVTVESIVAYINANVAAVEAQVRVYTADVAAYSATVDAEAKRLTAIADIYNSEMEGISAVINGLSAIAQVDIAQYKVASDVAIANANNAIKEIEMRIQQYGKDYDGRIERMKAVAAVSAQVVASAMSSVNASATIGNSESVSFSSAYDETKDVASGEVTTNQHYWDETGQ